MTASSPRTTWTLALAAYAVLATALLALYWLPEAKLLAGDERAYYQPRALAMLAGADWFDPQMLWPPLQTGFLAGVWTLTGPSLLAIQLVQLLLLALSGVLLWRLWWRLTGQAVAAAWAGALLAVNPLTVAFATYLWPEITYLFFSVLLAWCLVHLRHRGKQGDRALGVALLAGAVLGLCLLTKSLLTAFWPLLLLALIDRRRPGVSLARVAVFVATLGLVLAPTLYRGYQETGRPQIADSSWFNLWVGLADRYRSDLVYDRTGERMAEYLASAGDHHGRVRFAREQAMAIVAERGVAGTVAEQLGKQYFRLFDSRNFLVAQLPGPACRGYIGHYRLAESFLVRFIDGIARAWHVALLVLFAFGLAAWNRWRQPWFWLLAAFVGYQLALFLGLHVKSRFLLPMLPVICAFAGQLLAHWSQPARLRPSLSGTRGVIGLALALLLVLLAVAGPALDDACAQPPKSTVSGSVH